MSVSLKLQLRTKLEVGDFFFIEGVKDVNSTTLFLMVENHTTDNMKGDLCPIKIIDVKRGLVVARGTSPSLAIRDIGGASLGDTKIMGKFCVTQNH